MKAGSARNSYKDLINRMDSCSVPPHLKDAIIRCVEFHTSPAPGVLIGAYMVDYAMELLKATSAQKLFAVCETPKCLPDSLQEIAHCTTGNGRLRIVPIGKFAITMNCASDKEVADAVRVYIDCEKLKKFKTIDAWYANSPSYQKSVMKDRLQEEIFRAGRDILSYENVRITITPKQRWNSVTCPCCGDPVPDYLLENDQCGGCGSMKYYDRVSG
jgi:formylmethanofuran dehydrogenase subunit E